MNRRWLMGVIAVTLLVGGSVLAQRRGYWQRGITTDRGGVPRLGSQSGFPRRFVYLCADQIRLLGRPRRGGWATDYRDSDLNFSLRLQQLTSLKVNPEPIVLELTDEKLFDYPFIYIIEPGGLTFSEDEVAALRRYCLNGGFLMVDDFWGDTQLENMLQELERVFPDRKPFEVPLEHEIFHNVYDMKEKPQMPAISYQPEYYGGRLVTWEWSRDGSDTTTAALPGDHRRQRSHHGFHLPQHRSG